MNYVYIRNNLWISAKEENNDYQIHSRHRMVRGGLCTCGMGTEFRVSFGEIRWAVWTSQFSSVTQLCLTLCNSMDAACQFPCPSPTVKFAHSCPSSQWCHPTIASSVVPFSRCLQSFPASGSFPMSQFFASVGKSIGASASASVLPMNIEDWFPLGLTSFITLHSRDSQESSPTPQFKSINASVLSFLYSPTLTSIHEYWKNR